MGGEVVEDDDVSLFEFGAKSCLEIGGEDVGIDSSFNQEGSGDFIMPQGGDKGGGVPVAVRHFAQATLVMQRPSIVTSHFGVESGLIDEDQMFHVPEGLLTLPVNAGCGNVRPILLGGVRRFF